MQAAQATTNKTPLGTIEEQVERYKQVLDVMPAGVILLDTQGVVHEANPEAQRLLEMPLVGQKWFEVIQGAFAPREDDGHEVSLRNGRKVRLAISASPTGQLILITDLTETRLLQSRISDLQRLSSLGRMVASLAHQVRTPLSSAMLYASNLSAPSLPSSTKQRFQAKLMDRLHDLEKQVNDMLLFAKGGDNKVVKSFTVSELVSEFSPMVETALKNNQIDYHLEVEQEEAQLLGNANAIASALSNLVMNAIQISGKDSQVDVLDLCAMSLKFRFRTMVQVCRKNYKIKLWSRFLQLALKEQGLDLLLYRWYAVLTMEGSSLFLSKEKEHVLLSASHLKAARRIIPR